MVSFRYLPVASALHDSTALEREVSALGSVLDRVGGRRVDHGDRHAVDPLLFLILTGGTERRILEHWREAGDGMDHWPLEPLFLIAHPRQNSLPAAMEALARVHQLGGRGRILLLAGSGDEVGALRVADAALDIDVWRRLRSTRLGLIGESSDWLVASSPEAPVVERVWGPQIIPVDIGAALARYAAVPSAGGGSLARSVASRATMTAEPTVADVAAASRVYPVLRELIATYRLDALTVRCFDLIKELKTSGCLALAELIDEGFVAGCEGDVPSAIAMLWSQQLLGVVPWMANPAQVDVDRNEVRLAHCTIARSLTRSYGLRSHFESGLGVGIQGSPAPGDVTIIRIGGAALERLWLAEGSVVATDPLEDVCRTQMLVRLSGSSASDLLEDPLGNHLVVIPGRHETRLREWWRTMISAPPPSIDGWR